MLLAFESSTLQLLVTTHFCLGLMRTVATTTDVFSDIISDIRAAEKFATERCWFESHVSNKSNFHPVTAHEGLEGEYRYGSSLSSA